MWKQIELLKYHPNGAANFIRTILALGEGHPINNNLTGLMGLKAVDAADQCGFSRPRWPANHDTFAQLHIQRHVFQRLKIAKVFRHSTHLD